MERARALSERADVKALIDLREAVARRAEERGEGGSEATMRQLEELDGYLTQARVLRLKLDAEAFAKLPAATTPPR